MKPIGRPLPYDGLCAKNGISITGDCTQMALVRELDHVEAFPNDPDRVRFVWKNPVGGSFTYGQWFSRRWPMPLHTAKVLPLQWL